MRIEYPTAIDAYPITMPLAERNNYTADDPPTINDLMYSLNELEKKVGVLGNFADTDWTNDPDPWIPQSHEYRLNTLEGIVGDGTVDGSRLRGEGELEGLDLTGPLTVVTTRIAQHPDAPGDYAAFLEQLTANAADGFYCGIAMGLKLQGGASQYLGARVGQYNRILIADQGLGTNASAISLYNSIRPQASTANGTGAAYKLTSNELALWDVGTGFSIDKVIFFHANGIQGGGASKAVTNAYGLYLEDLATAGVTNAWGIYQLGTGVKNLLQGSLNVRSGYQATSPNGTYTGAIIGFDNSNILTFGDIAGETFSSVVIKGVLGTTITLGDNAIDISSSDIFLLGAVYGSRAAGGTLTISSTNSGTKGFIYLGSTSGLIYDEAQRRVKIGTSGTADSTLHLYESKSISGLTADGYAGATTEEPYYGAGSGQTVTRHNYIDLRQVQYFNVTITDACVFRFNAAIGTHKAIDSGTTKTSPGTVTAWMKININGTVHYIPAYASKTS